MTGQYYHGYLSSHNRNGWRAVGPFSRVQLLSDHRRAKSFRVEDDVVEPVVVLLPHGRFLPGATLGQGMLTWVALDWVLDDVMEADYAAEQEAELWADRLAEEAAREARLVCCAECGAEVDLDDIDGDGCCSVCVEAALEWETDDA